MSSDTEGGRCNFCHASLTHICFFLDTEEGMTFCSCLTVRHF